MAGEHGTASSSGHASINTVSIIPQSDKRGDVFLEYIGAARRSELPPRVIYLFIILASAHGFFALWNSRPGSWMDARKQAFQNAIQWVDCGAPNDGDKSKLKQFSEAQSVFAYVGIDDKDERRAALRGIVNLLNSGQNDWVRMVHVPVLGVRFDVNDLGIFSGFVLIVALLMFRFALSREFQNAIIAYEFAKKLDFAAGGENESTKQRQCYELLSMGQVILTPPVRGGVVWYWRHLAKLGICVPVLVQLFIVINDLETRNVGLLFSSSNTIAVFMISFAALVCIVALAISACAIWVRMELFWWDTAVRLNLVEAKKLFRAPGNE